MDNETKKDIMPAIKKVVLFFSLWIFTHFIIITMGDMWDDGISLIYALSLTLLIVFVWNRVSRKYL